MKKMELDDIVGARIVMSKIKHCLILRDKDGSDELLGKRIKSLEKEVDRFLTEVLDEKDINRHVIPSVLKDGSISWQAGETALKYLEEINNPKEKEKPEEDPVYKFMPPLGL